MSPTNGSAEFGNGENADRDSNRSGAMPARTNDLDAVVADFLSELNALYDELGLADRKAGRPDGSEGNSPGSPQIAVLDAPKGKGPDVAEPGSKSATYRNIDVLLKDDVARTRRIEEELPLTFRSLHGLKPPRSGNHGIRSLGSALLGRRRDSSK
jgi:hypothetical protein